MKEGNSKYVKYLSLSISNSNLLGGLQIIDNGST